ncbi:MAG: TetR/AcrR family transcriptional regulator [Microthrixaceae bacterium]
MVSDKAIDRRERKRTARRDHLLEIALDLVDREGVDGLTMTALGQESDYATASLYTYFPSRSALMAAVQVAALGTLAEVARTAVEGWDRELPPGTPVRTASLARLVAFADLFLEAPVTHRREFRLQQQLLASAGAEDPGDAAGVVPAAMTVLDVPRRLLVDAVSDGALRPSDSTEDPLGNPVEGDLTRTLTWVTALNGTLLVDALRTGLPLAGVHLGRELTRTLLLGWGARPDDLATATDLARSLHHPGGTR